LDNNEKGELCVRRDLSFLGYYGDPEKSRAAYDGEWFRTNDIGYFDEEGFFYFIDRNKELLKYENYQITPSELESVINGIEGVVSSCIVGVLKENTGNDIIHAFVIVDESKGLTEDIVLNYVNERVMEPKRLRGGVHFVKTFPVGFSGKVNKRKLKDMAEMISKKS
jgi:4-coumarate--CoA ligase